MEFLRDNDFSTNTFQEKGDVLTSLWLAQAHDHFRGTLDVKVHLLLPQHPHNDRHALGTATKRELTYYSNFVRYLAKTIHCNSLQSTTKV